MTKVVLVTIGILNSLEVAFNETFGDYFKCAKTYDEDGNILTADIDTRHISRGNMIGSSTTRYIINSSKIRRLFNRATQAERDAISARYNNVDILAWLDSKEVDLSEVEIIRYSI
jgi:hypothetical protein